MTIEEFDTLPPQEQEDLIFNNSITICGRKFSCISILFNFYVVVTSTDSGAFGEYYSELPIQWRQEIAYQRNISTKDVDDLIQKLKQQNTP